MSRVDPLSLWTSLRLHIRFFVSQVWEVQLPSFLALVSTYSNVWSMWAVLADASLAFSAAPEINQERMETFAPPSPVQVRACLTVLSLFCILWCHSWCLKSKERQGIHRSSTLRHHWRVSRIFLNIIRVLILWQRVPTFIKLHLWVEFWLLGTLTFRITFGLYCDSYVAQWLSGIQGNCAGSEFCTRPIWYPSSQRQGYYSRKGSRARVRRSRVSDFELVNHRWHESWQ